MKNDQLFFSTCCNMCQVSCVTADSCCPVCLPGFSLSFEHLGRVLEWACFSFVFSCTSRVEWYTLAVVRKNLCHCTVKTGGLAGSLIYRDTTHHITVLEFVWQIVLQALAAFSSHTYSCRLRSPYVEFFPYLKCYYLVMSQSPVP